MKPISQNSKYFVKGTYVKRIKEFTDRELGKDSIIEAAKSLDLIFPDMLLASVKYNASEIFLVTENLILSRKRDLQKFYFDMATYALEADLNSVYKMFVNLSGPQFVYKMLPQINNAYFNFITQEVIINETNHVRVVASVLNDKYIEHFVIHSIKGGHTGCLQVCKQKITNYFISEPFPHKKEQDWNSYTLDITYEKI